MSEFERRLDGERAGAFRCSMIKMCMVVSSLKPRTFNLYDVCQVHLVIKVIVQLRFGMDALLPRLPGSFRTYSPVCLVSSLARRTLMPEGSVTS